LYVKNLLDLQKVCEVDERFARLVKGQNSNPLSPGIMVRFNNIACSRHNGTSLSTITVTVGKQKILGP